MPVIALMTAGTNAGSIAGGFAVFGDPLGGDAGRGRRARPRARARGRGRLAAGAGPGALAVGDDRAPARPAPPGARRSAPVTRRAAARAACSPSSPCPPRSPRSSGPPGSSTSSARPTCSASGRACAARCRCSSSPAGRRSPCSASPPPSARPGSRRRSSCGGSAARRAGVGGRARAPGAGRAVGRRRRERRGRLDPAVRSPARGLGQPSGGVGRGGVRGPRRGAGGRPAPARRGGGSPPAGRGSSAWARGHLRLRPRLLALPRLRSGPGSRGRRGRHVPHRPLLLRGAPRAAQGARLPPGRIPRGRRGRSPLPRPLRAPRRARPAGHDVQVGRDQRPARRARGRAPDPADADRDPVRQVAAASTTTPSGPTREPGATRSFVLDTVHAVDRRFATVAARRRGRAHRRLLRGRLRRGQRRAAPPAHVRGGRSLVGLLRPDAHGRLPRHEPGAAARELAGALRRRASRRGCGACPSTPSSTSAPTTT